jgi:dTDP-4-dehydrorhamnose reductase
MKSVYITGIAGMLGSNLAYLLRDRYRVFGVDLHPITIYHVTESIFSVMDTGQLRQDLILNQVDTVIHCAALVDVDGCEANPEYAEQINYILTRDITNICESLHIKLIFISTDAVFDGKADYLYRETDTPNPVSVYGKTKLKAEEAVLAGKDNLVVRTNIYGFNYRDKFSFGEWILNSLQNNMPLSMFYDLYFSPLMVNELAELLDQCMEKELCGLYHACSTGSISKYDIAKAISKEFEIAGTIHHISMKDYNFKAPRTQNMGLCNDRLSNDLAIHIRTPLEGVAQFKQLYDTGYPEALRKGQ